MVFRSSRLVALRRPSRCMCECENGGKIWLYHRVFVYNVYINYFFSPFESYVVTRWLYATFSSANLTGRKFFFHRCCVSAIRIIFTTFRGTHKTYDCDVRRSTSRITDRFWTTSSSALQIPTRFSVLFVPIPTRRPTSHAGLFFFLCTIEIIYFFYTILFIFIPDAYYNKYLSTYMYGWVCVCVTSCKFFFCRAPWKVDSLWKKAPRKTSASTSTMTSWSRLAKGHMGLCTKR